MYKAQQETKCKTTLPTGKELKLLYISGKKTKQIGAGDNKQQIG